MNALPHRMRLASLLSAIAAALLISTAFCPGRAEGGSPPNIVWIVGEDASPHLSSYGETTISTPHLDALASGGIRFTRTFVTCPVCSPSRSAMVTGMYQTTLGAHNHRSQNKSRKAGGNTEYYESYRLPEGVKLIPQMLKEAGYFVTLGAGPECNKPGKTDYNFIHEPVYDAADWQACPEEKPFFAQIMLRGGKNRGAKQHGTDPEQVELPPYYPDAPALRQDWAAYLNSWVQMDQEVGRIMSRLKESGRAENTVVFFWTDHGVSHLRGKQFLYEEGIHVPLIVHFGNRRRAGIERDDLTVHIDVAASTLGLAGIEVPAHLQGRDLFAEDYQPREMIFSARDRCDESVDVIRCVRTGRYKYIRNFLSHYGHAQPNQYKDGKQIVQNIRALHRRGELSPLQARLLAPTRPAEELYDLENDPQETVNLAGQAEHRETVARLRTALYDWMNKSRDQGLIPEPLLEEWGRTYGSKYAALRHPDQQGIIPAAIRVIQAGEAGEREDLYQALRSDRPTLRYWAATWLGKREDHAAQSPLAERAAGDPSPSVRIAAAVALCRLGQSKKYAAQLAEMIDHENLLVGMYAIRGLERIGPAARSQLPAIKKAQKNPYEFTRRYARRLTRELGAG